MPHHESVTDEFIAELDAGFDQAAELVRRAPNWPETQKLMLTGTYPYKVALDRVQQGWSREEIETELGIRTALRAAPKLRIIGNRRIEDEDLASE